VNLVQYDPWEGLIDITTGKPLGSQESDSLSMMMSGGVTDIQSALRTADELMKEQTTIFIIKNIAEKTPILLQAIRSWTVNDHIFQKKSTVFIFADNAASLLDDYTKRLTAVVPIPISTEDERTEIIKGLSKDFHIDYNPNLVSQSAGLTLHDTEASLLMSYFTNRNFTTEELAHFKTEMIRKTGVLSFEEPDYGFEAVGGYEVTKSFIDHEIINILQEPERATRLGLRPPRGVLLFGPPGTGKTLIARSLAHELKLPFINFRLEDIMRGVVGESEQRLRSAIDLIEELAPCLVFIDEIDRLGHRTDVSTDSGVSRRIFSMLLEWLGMKDRKAILVATTNEPEYLDSAMLRPGRLDRKVPLLYPDAEAREAILKVHLEVVRQVPYTLSEAHFEKIVAETELYTGAELEELVLRAGREAFRENADRVTFEEFYEALHTFNLNMGERKKQLDHYLELAEKYCDDKQFLKAMVREQTSFDKVEAIKREIEIGT
jgi:ATP-dependent Zn protease